MFLTPIAEQLLLRYDRRFVSTCKLMVTETLTWPRQSYKRTVALYNVRQRIARFSLHRIQADATLIH